MSASIHISARLFEKGGYGSSPQVAIDPVVMALSLVMNLQTLRSRELAGDVPAVIFTVRFINAGLKYNVISDEASIGLNIYTYIHTQRESIHVQQQILDAIGRITESKAQGFRSPKTPEITTSDIFAHQQQ
jgi:hippurate hydrolase